jgi:hypothetical protein
MRSRNSGNSGIQGIPGHCVQFQVKWAAKSLYATLTSRISRTISGHFRIWKSKKGHKTINLEKLFDYEILDTDLFRRWDRNDPRCTSVHFCTWFSAGFSGQQLKIQTGFFRPFYGILLRSAGSIIVVVYNGPVSNLYWGRGCSFGSVTVLLYSKIGRNCALGCYPIWALFAQVSFIHFFVQIRLVNVLQCAMGWSEDYRFRNAFSSVPYG